MRSKTSKKDDKLRAEEIRKAASEPLLSWISEKSPAVVRDPGGSLVVGEIMIHAEGGMPLQLNVTFHRILRTSTDKTAASKALLDVLAASFPSSDPATPHPITLPHVSRLYKLLLQGGHFSQSTKSIERSSSFSPLAFATEFVDVVSKDNTIAMAKGEAVFVVAALCETVASAGGEATEMSKTLKSWLGGDVKKQLAQDQEQRGRKVLLEQIASL